MPLIVLRRAKKGVFLFFMSIYDTFIISSQQRWRGKLEYSVKADKTGIEIKWKELVHKPDDCLMALYFYLNNQPTAALQTGLTNQPETIFIPMTGTFDLKVTFSVTKAFGRGAA